MAQKKALTFDIERSPRAEAETPPKKEEPRERMHPVSTRIPASKHRKLKARAALLDMSMQDIIAQAIDDYLESHPAEE